VSQDKLIGYYDRADIMLNTSLWQEPFGLTSIEAMARGLPIIASRVGGTAEIVISEVNGLLVEPGDEYALASAIRRLASDSIQRARLARAARHMVEEHFTLEENIRRVADHLQRAVLGGSVQRVVRAASAENVSETPEGARRTV
jgi:glycosyltransferase involved in cell wall biosynthesis